MGPGKKYSMLLRLLHSGIISLFLGAVILALGYKLFQMWIEPALTENDTDLETSNRV